MCRHFTQIDKRRRARHRSGVLEELRRQHLMSEATRSRRIIRHVELAILQLVDREADRQAVEAHLALAAVILLHERNDKCAQVIIVAFVMIDERDQVLWVLLKCVQVVPASAGTHARDPGALEMDSFESLRHTFAFIQRLRRQIAYLNTREVVLEVLKGDPELAIGLEVELKRLALLRRNNCPLARAGHKVSSDAIFVKLNYQPVTPSTFPFGIRAPWIANPQKRYLS